MPIDVAVINASTVIKDAQVPKVVAALQKQVTNDFYPVWGVDARLSIQPKSGPAPAKDAWWLVILDDSDQAGALGYHDLTNEGLPLGKAFAGSDQKAGLQWTVTVSHELLEMLGDPDINLTAFVEANDGKGGRLYAYEVCDACEDDQFSYDIDGVAVSDFVYPSWFESFRKKDSTTFDRMERIHSPFELLPGGYIGIYDVLSGSGWQQLTNDHAAARRRLRPVVGSRRERRRTPRHEWRPSSVKFGR